MVELPEIDRQDVLGVLKTYQLDIVSPAIESGSAEALETAAKDWLSADGPRSTIAFGGEAHRKQPFFDAFLAEIAALLCGTNEVYAKERKEIEQQLKGGKSAGWLKHLVSYIAGAVALKLGVAAALLVPPLCLVLLLVSKMGIRAWCSSRGCPVT